MVYDSPKKLEQLRRQTRDKKHIRLPVLIMLDEGFTHEVTIVYEDQRDVKNIDPIEMLLIDSRDSKNVNS